MFPADRNPEPVSVEYDCRGGRSTKTFSDPYKARLFYVSKFKSGHKPAVKGAIIMATKKKTAKKTAKKTVTKKTAKKAAAPKKTAKKKAVATTGESGVERSSDVAWSESKVAVFHGLKKLGAVSSTTARSGNDVAKAADCPTHAVRHYCYHAKAAGLTGVLKVEGIRGYAFHLTAKGAKVDLKTILKN